LELKLAGEMYLCKSCHKWHLGKAPYVMEDLEGGFITWVCKQAYEVYLDQIAQGKEYLFTIKRCKKGEG
jgi:hypothetical protein